MTAANSRVPVSLESTPVEYPEDCAIWVSDGLSGSFRFNMSAPKETRGDRCCWRFVLQPGNGQRPQQERLKSAGHDHVAMFFFFDGEVFRFTMMSAAGPRLRFRDYGPCAVLTLYNDDSVVKMTKMAKNLFTRDIPRLNGTVVVATWNRLRSSERCRHVAIVPALTINWSARK